MGSEVNRLEQVLALLAEPNRLRIILALGLDCRPVSRIVEQTGLSQTNVSFHLRQLREAGLVRPQRHGKFIYYCLYDARLLDALGALHAAIMDDHHGPASSPCCPSGRRP